MRHLPEIVKRVTGAFLDAVDGLSPGLVEALYVTGSVALGDFHEARSDVDFVAIVNGAGARAANALASAHAAVRLQWPSPTLEGTHLSWVELATGPASCAFAPCVTDKGFHPRGRHALNPVTWHELADHGIALRGPRLEDSEVWYERAALASWTRTNLAEYWEPWLRRYAAGPADYDHDDDAMVWGVLGISRLHYTLATGRITSKTGAGEHGLETFERQWHPILAEALRARRAPESSSAYGTVMQRRQEVVTYMNMVLRAARLPER